MTWCEAGPEVGETGQLLLLPTLKREGLCPEQKGCLWPGMAVAEPLGSVDTSVVPRASQSIPGVSQVLSSASAMASGQCLTAFSSCYLLSWTWSWEPRLSQDSLDTGVVCQFMCS